MRNFRALSALPAKMHPRIGFFSKTRASFNTPQDNTPGDSQMNSIIYLVGLVVIVMAILSFVGMR